MVNYEAVLTSYLATVVANETNRLIKVWLRKNKGNVYISDLKFSEEAKLHTNRPLYIDSYSEKHFVELSSDTVESELLAMVLGTLTERDLYILNKVVNGYTDSEIAETLGVARQTVNKLKLRSYGIIKQGLNKNVS